MGLWRLSIGLLWALLTISDLSTGFLRSFNGWFLTTASRSKIFGDAHLQCYFISIWLHWASSVIFFIIQFGYRVEEWFSEPEWFHTWGGLRSSDPGTFESNYLDRYRPRGRVWSEIEPYPWTDDDHKDGGVLTAARALPPVTQREPFSDMDRWRKFQDCCQKAFDSQSMTQLCEQLLNLS